MSNNNESDIALEIDLYGLNSGVVLAIIVGVLVEFTVILALIEIVNKTRFV